MSSFLGVMGNRTPSSPVLGANHRGADPAMAGRSYNLPGSHRAAGSCTRVLRTPCAHTTVVLQPVLLLCYTIARNNNLSTSPNMPPKNRSRQATNSPLINSTPPSTPTPEAPPLMPPLPTLTKTRTRTGLGLAVAFLVAAAAAAGISYQNIQLIKQSLPNLSQAKKLAWVVPSCTTTGPGPDLRVKTMSKTGQQITYTVENVGTAAASPPTIMEIYFLGDPDNTGSWSLVTTAGTSTNQTQNSIPGNCGTWTNTINVVAPSPLTIPLQGTVVNSSETQNYRTNNFYMLQ